MKKINVGLIGAGTIGSGLVDVFNENRELILRRTGIDFILKGVCDNDEGRLRDISGADGLKKTVKADDILDADDIDIVVELIGGVDPAKDFIMKALGNRKHVVTANKALLSHHWKEIFKIARENGLYIGFEASVGGGIPIIKTICESFVANRFEAINGILNGTTNFILTMMSDENCPFESALKIAQEKGIAESNPELDISGKDSAHKLAILAMMGFGVEVAMEDIFTEGIENISPIDITYASGWGYNIKLLAIAKKSSEGIQLSVYPALVPVCNLLANVKGEDNAILLRGNFVGESLLYGKGAGKRPTASAVMSDIVEIGTFMSAGNRSEALGDYLYADNTLGIMAMERVNMPYYLRFSVIDQTGVLAGISNILSRHNISIATMSQEERKEGESVPVIMLTHNANEGEMKKAISEIDKMDFVADKTVMIRIGG